MNEEGIISVDENGQLEMTGIPLGKYQGKIQINLKLKNKTSGAKTVPKKKLLRMFAIHRSDFLPTFNLLDLACASSSKRISTGLL